MKGCTKFLNSQWNWNTTLCMIYISVFGNVDGVTAILAIWEYWRGYSHFSVNVTWGYTFFTTINTRSWICQQNRHEKFRYFELMINVLTQILKSKGGSTFQWILGPDDVINNVINSNLCKHNHNPVMHLYIQFNDDIFVRFFPKCTNLFRMQHRRGQHMGSTCDVIDDIITMKILFFCIF